MKEEFGENNLRRKEESINEVSKSVGIERIVVKGREKE